MDARVFVAAAGIALMAGAASAQTYGQAGGYDAAPGPCGPSSCGAPGPLGFGPGQVANESYPANAVPGQCFTKMLEPEVTEPVTEHVLVSPEKTELRVIPGSTTWEEKSVLVKEQSVELVTVPATFRTETETMVVTPAHTRTETIPATYDTVIEQVKVKEGYITWRPGAAVAGYAPGAANTYSAAPTSRPPGVSGQGVIEHNPAYGGMTTRQLPTGEVLCLVEVPPEYKTITKQVLRTPARAEEIPVPAETRVVTRQVIDVPAHVEKRVAPPVYETVHVQVHGPDITQPYTVPPVYRDYVKVRLVAPSRFVWKQIDCQTEVAHGAYGAPPMYQPQAYPPTYGQQPY